MIRVVAVLAVLLLPGCTAAGVAAFSAGVAALSAAPEAACNVAKARATLKLAPAPSKELCPDPAP